MTNKVQTAGVLSLVLLLGSVGLADAKPKHSHVPAASSYKALADPVWSFDAYRSDPPVQAIAPPVWAAPRASGAYGAILEGRNPAAGALP
ncbi:MAG TPA: hypothetical protein VEQ35_06440 [Beijerinckia sp.]|jgi:hypothetical protein|nr:hypothetical protein [Beijerinckia sp.]